jgi:hypothetical protein
VRERMLIASGKDSFKSQLGPVAIEFTIVNKQELELSWIEESCRSRLPWSKKTIPHSF